MANLQIPSRVVSLVPSLTESMFDLGLGSRLAGVTSYCVHPFEKTRLLASVGGPGDARLEDILSLTPDLVLAGQEENDPETIHGLERAGVQVFLAFPHSITEAVSMLLDLCGLFQDEEAAMRVKTLQVTLEWQAAAALSHPGLRTFCPIWTEGLSEGNPWWMTFNGATYASSVLSLFAAENVFASRLRRYPLEADLGRAEAEDPGTRDVRYPRMAAAEIAACQAEVVLFPSEPFPFTPGDIEVFSNQFPDLPAVKNGRLYTVDGSLITWYGTRLALALEQLGDVFEM